MYNCRSRQSCVMRLVLAEGIKQRASNERKLDEIRAIYGVEGPSGRGMEMTIFAKVLVHVEVLSVQFLPVSCRAQCIVD